MCKSIINSKPYLYLSVLLILGFNLSLGLADTDSPGMPLWMQLPKPKPNQLVMPLPNDTVTAQQELNKATRQVKKTTGLFSIGQHSALKNAKSPQPPVAHFTQKNIDAILWPLLTQHTSFEFPKKYFKKTHPKLPLPTHTHIPKRVLTLQDAIWLALRGNPDIQVDQLNRIEQKFGLMLEHYNLFEPHFSDQLTVTKTFGAGGGWQYSPSFNSDVTSPIGTKFDAGYSNGQLGSDPDTFNFSVSQPLLKGFGYYTHILAWRTDLANEAIDRLNYKAEIISEVVQIIQDYTGLLTQYNTLRSQKEDLKQTEIGIKQDALKVKAGQMAPSDYLRSKVQAQSDRLQIVTTENNVVQAYHKFLTELGLRTNTNIQIEQQIHWRRYTVPDLSACITIALHNNINYRKAKIAVDNATRALKVANNNLWPQLDVEASDQLAHGSPNDASISLTASVPIDPMPERNAALTAKITLEEAKINLKKEKQKVISNITTQWTAVQSAYNSIKIGMDLVKMDKKSLANTKLQLDYGMTTMFEYLTTQETVLNDEITLISDETSYITAVAILRQTMATTLDAWHIKLRY